MSRKSKQMTDEAKPWRQSPFERNKKYIVRRDFRAMRDEFRCNEVLTYDVDHYSRHDNCTAYLFYDTDSKRRIWDVNDDTELEIWQKYFSLLEIADGT